MAAAPPPGTPRSIPTVQVASPFDERFNIRTVPLDSKHEMVQPYASPFLGVRALGSAAAVTCKLPYGTGDRETVTCP